MDSVSRKVEPGEHWAILEPNEAGKMTLLKIICGYRWPNAGGRSIEKRNRWLIWAYRGEASVG